MTSVSLTSSLYIIPHYSYPHCSSHDRSGIHRSFGYSLPSTLNDDLALHCGLRTTDHRSVCEAAKSSCLVSRRNRRCSYKIPEQSAKSQCWTTTSASLSPVCQVIPFINTSSPTQNLSENCALIGRFDSRWSNLDRQSPYRVPIASIDSGRPRQHRIYHKARRWNPTGQLAYLTSTFR